MDSVMLDKSKKFAVRIVRMHRYLCDEKREYVISRQALRSGTSIGANIAEAEYGSTRKEFASMLYIALRECAETLYWLELLVNTGSIRAQQYRSLRADCEELRKMLSSATKTLQT